MSQFTEEQEKLLKKLDVTKQFIHSLCAKSKCERYPRCKKFSTVCTSDTNSPYRKLIRNNGGDFDEYIRLRRILIERNYPLVIDQAKSMGGYSTDDLCQEGVLGLAEAIDRFNLSYGNQFSTFAYIYIRKSILNFIRENQTVRVATKISYLTKITEEAFDKLVQNNSNRVRCITPEQLLREVKRIRRQRKMCRMKIRITELTGHLDRLKLEVSARLLVPLEVEKVHIQEHKDGLYRLLNHKLEEELERVPVCLSESIKLRFGLGEYGAPTKVPEIAAAIGMTSQNVEYHIKKFFERKT